MNQMEGERGLDRYTGYLPTSKVPGGGGGNTTCREYCLTVDTRVTPHAIIYIPPHAIIYIPPIKLHVFYLLCSTRGWYRYTLLHNPFYEEN